MPEYRCSMVVDRVEVDGIAGVTEPIPCGKTARRKMMIHPGYDAGFWMDGCCEDCVQELRDVVKLTEAEIELLYPVWAEAVRFYRPTAWDHVKNA